MEQIQLYRQQAKERTLQEETVLKNGILENLSVIPKRAFERCMKHKNSSWLTVLPLMKHHFDLSANEFRDALALRYGRSLLNCPAFCDGCGESFDLNHALCCKKGGLIIQRHNEVRDAVGDLADLVWNQVHKEPIIRDADDSKSIPALVADLGVRGVWSP